ncbi:MAG: hypothetical protein FJX54_17030 [Alphaproteobacteria bacterium]|nr:hypothetical protein [Alphaproteobacteria bacterium]
MITRRSEPALRSLPYPSASPSTRHRKNAIFDRDYAMALVALRPGISDREIAASVFGPGTPSSTVTPTCRALANERVIKRKLRADGLLGNFLRED